MNWQLSIRPEQVIVRQDPEFADVGNPNGAIWGDVFYIVAVENKGDRMIYTSADFETMEAAEKYLADMDPASPDVDPDWQYIDPVYGSEAYVQEESYIVQREREDARLNDNLSYLL